MTVHLPYWSDCDVLREDSGLLKATEAALREHFDEEIVEEAMRTSQFLRSSVVKDLRGGRHRLPPMIWKHRENYQIPECLRLTLVGMDRARKAAARAERALAKEEAKEQVRRRKAERAQHRVLADCVKYTDAEVAARHELSPAEVTMMRCEAGVAEGSGVSVGWLNPWNVQGVVESIKSGTQILVWFEDEGLTRAEIAERLHLSRTSGIEDVARRLANARFARNPEGFPERKAIAQRVVTARADGRDIRAATIGCTSTQLTRAKKDAATLVVLEATREGRLHT